MKRRDFLKTSGLVAAGLSVARGAQAAGDDCIKVGLVGCGGRARGASRTASLLEIIAKSSLFAMRLNETPRMPPKLSVQPRMNVTSLMTTISSGDSKL